ncbi:arginine deiminase-related protein [Lipingzhangella sp. LS1_29]|uniref:Arginine deiminase-related protein n=1 Tax=Lipingzhangella rawalii TaxID=2055835 RepID=A0ABU2H8A9_9ACTN|nr:arginine deiminase-related protein [Lipingzhangella rawalii]MDS1271543.1 arginine deiminase-related protein [Lipingzhangella rawalii]
MLDYVSEWQDVRSSSGGAPLPWGYRYLLCPPRFFDVWYSINPWMDPDVKVDHELAHDQWHQLGVALREAGAKLEELEPLPEHPDAVFTANHGVVDGSTFWPAPMRFPERTAEVDHTAEWFRQHNWSVADPGLDSSQEGTGDALSFADTLVTGFGRRSDRRAYDTLSRRAGWRVLPVELTDPAFYHIDIAFCPLNDRTALIVADAFTEEGLRCLRRLVPDPVLCTRDEGLAFAANSVVVGRRIVMPSCSARLGRLLENRGFEIAVSDVSEFRKAGGGCRCLTLPLDTVLPAHDSVAARPDARMDGGADR